MISLFKYILSKLFYKNIICITEGNHIESENVENLLVKIDEIRQTDNITEESNLNLIYDEAGCFYKSGIVSLVNNNYILIENKYVCEKKYIIPTNLKEGDKVYYIAYKAGKNQELKIYKIISKLNISWDNEDEFESYDKNEQNRNKVKENVNLDVPGSDQVLKKRQLNERIIIGKIDRRQGRDIFLEDDTYINLDNISSTFIPMIGDWVKLDCLVEVDENINNLKGEILEIKSMLPLRQLSKLGKVTEYNNILEFGMIEKVIVFNKNVCISGYIPFVGDKVVVQSIESDQGIQQHWRALTVVPFDVSNRFEKSILKCTHKLIEDINELIQNKENIKITNPISVTLDAKTEKEIEVIVKNNGKYKQNIYKCLFISKKSESQLILVSPKDEVHLKPLDEIIFKFKCKPRFVGNSEELVIFKFGNFKIGRIFQIKVNRIDVQNQILEKNILNIYNNTEILQDYEEGSYIKGIKPYKSAKFIPIRPVTWKIPQILWSTINEIIVEKMTHSEAEFTLLRKVPCFEQQLSFQNYKQRFDYLLYLEEIAQIHNMQKFNMNSAVMQCSGEYLCLNVPGLTEKRPSLLIGDKVIVSFKWDSYNGKLNYEGYIHVIKNSDIFLKFNENFHEKYQGQDCQINFKVSTNVFQRCHAAISVVINRLGSEFLFPTKVVQNKPQYNFIENDDEVENDKLFLNKLSQVNIQDINVKQIKRVQELLYKRKLNWFNKKLNIYQKEAIKNILQRLACSLPYVIFGPPGTGKTITLCETILQILFTMSESRILVATPSNSSANLIAERLLDSKLLKPGDLVRLVGYNYLGSESIPEELIPYCATASISDECQRSNQNTFDPRGCRSNVTLHILCRHRIIIGTCSAVGILYNMGCKPGHFTHIMVDEAGQPSEPEIMIPLSLAHIDKTQVVLAGDPEQLGPINQSQMASSFGLSDSFLVRLLQQFPYQRDSIGFVSGYDPRLLTKLLINYRSLPDLLDLPNKLFYENELIPQVDPENSNEAELLKSLSDMLPKRLESPPTVIFHNVNGKNLQDPDSPSWYNPEEATQVYIYLLDLYNHGLKSSDVGIITPYSKQVYRIRSLLAELEFEIPKVGSVEEFQGQERKVIILSIVRTAEDKIKEDMKHALGFISARERLNVAITRAQTLLIIIGNSNLLKQDFYWHRVLDHCFSQGSYIDIQSHY